MTSAPDNPNLFPRTVDRDEIVSRKRLGQVWDPRSASRPWARHDHTRHTWGEKSFRYLTGAQATPSTLGFSRACDRGSCLAVHVVATTNNDNRYGRSTKSTIEIDSSPLASPSESIAARSSAKSPSVAVTKKKSTTRMMMFCC